MDPPSLGVPSQRDGAKAQGKSPRCLQVSVYEGVGVKEFRNMCVNQRLSAVVAIRTKCGWGLSTRSPGCNQLWQFMARTTKQKGVRWRLGYARMWPNRIWPKPHLANKNPNLARPELVFQCVDRIWPNRIWPILVFQCFGQIFRCWCLLVPVGACWCLLVPVGACWCCVCVCVVCVW